MCLRTGTKTLYTSSYNITKRNTIFREKKTILPASVKVGREALVQTDDGGSVPEVISQRNTEEIPLPCRICTANSKGIFCMRRTEINPKKGFLSLIFYLLKGAKIFSDSSDLRFFDSTPNCIP